MPKTAIVCFRNDFRLEDNPALQEAILSGMMITVGKALKPASQRSGPMPMNEICFNEHF